MADLERQPTPARTLAMAATLKSLVAEARTEACKLHQLNPKDYTSPADLHKDVVNIHTLLDARIKELESAVEHVVTANEISTLNSARKTGSIVDVSEAAQGVLSDPTQQTSDQDQTATSEDEGQPRTSQPEVSSEPHPDTITNTASPSTSPAASHLRFHHQNPYCKAMRKERYKEYIDDRHDIPTLELQQLRENLAATIDTLASNADQIQKAQVSGLAEAMKHRPTDTWNLKPRDGGDVNRNIITVDSEYHIRMRTTNEEHLFHQPGFQGVNYRMEKGEVALKLLCFINNPECSIPHYAGVVESPLWDLCPLHAGRLAEI
ncbi:hypothetical protein FMUND_13517 [Fusarium mundagurra]|uniref:Uncharacterized protein n=1 Tax=Fusarium mundagurra TaxID=1567541 RepID=A0A8H5XYF3_9HYPO|nr:hypothetical protein FMUND_13517 [Fusarium mundagurra]